MNEPVKTTFIFMRHGEPVGGKIFRGSTDDPLTDIGWQQMHDSVKDLTYEQIISSPLKRCKEFSSRLNEKLSLPLKVIDDLQEIHLGDWEGLSVEQVNKLDSDALENFWAAPHRFTPPSAERFINFEKRILSVWNKMLEQQVSKNKPATILVVSHAGVMMVLLKHWLEIPVENILNIKLNYASKVRVEVYDAIYNLKPQLYIEHGYDF